MHYFHNLSSASGALPPNLHSGSIVDPASELSSPDPQFAGLVQKRTSRERENGLTITLTLNLTQTQT